MKKELQGVLVVLVIGLLAQQGGWAMSYKPRIDCPYKMIAESGALAINYVNVRDFGAKGDGIHDDTVAIQNALNYAKEKLPICYLPPGLYRLNHTLNIPGGVTLIGASGGANHSRTPNGSTLLIYGGKGNTDGEPAIILDWSSTIRQITIHYPEQLPPPNVIPYPWTIQGRGELCQIIDVIMTNPYKAMDFGSHHNELHLIRNVFACPLKVGVYVDRCTDIGRIENVHFSPNFWKRSRLEPKLPTGGFTHQDDIDGFQNKLLSPYLIENFIGFKLGKTDWQYISNSFVIFAKIGFLFDDFGNGSGNALITQSGADCGPVAVDIRKSQGHAGVQFANCQFMATILIGPENKGTIKIANCGFWPVRQTGEQIIKEDSGTLILTGCHFADWDIGNYGKPCIRVSSGRILISSTEFMTDKTAILFEEGLIAASLISSVFRGQGKIVNNSKINIEAGFNIKQ